jgi:hypothetical protein
MAKAASIPAHRRNRSAAVRQAGTAIGISSVTASESQSRADTARGAIVAYQRRLIQSKQAASANAAKVNEYICDDFRDMKKAARTAAKKEYQRLATAHDQDPKKNPAPHGTENDANRNGSKGLRQRRRPLENFQECLERDPQVAADSVAEGSKLSWTEKTQVWAHRKTMRCEESRLKIVVGTDSDGCIHSLGEGYREAYVVQKRTLPDGTEQEFCEVTVGPKGATENIEVVISTAPSGEVYQQMRRVVIESRNLLSNARKFLSDTEDEQTLPQFIIPTVADNS